jgi:hypothetical protein
MVTAGNPPKQFFADPCKMPRVTRKEIFLHGSARRLVVLAEVSGQPKALISRTALACVNKLYLESDLSVYLRVSRPSICGNLASSRLIILWL